MSLRDELSLKTEIRSPAQEALLSLYVTTSVLKRHADAILSEHGLTDVQFNALLLLHYQGGKEGGLTQVELSRMMMVNRANITSLVDRLERERWVERTSVPGDRRVNLIRLTGEGKEAIAEGEKKYRREVARVMGTLHKGEQKKLVEYLQRLRDRVPR